jgi:hypothetical protein
VIARAYDVICLTSVFLSGGIVTGYAVKSLESHTALNYFSDSAFWHVPSDFKKIEEDRGVEII